MLIIKINITLRDGDGPFDIMGEEAGIFPHDKLFFFLFLHNKLFV